MKPLRASVSLMYKPSDSRVRRAKCPYRDPWITGMSDPTLPGAGRARRCTRSWLWALNDHCEMACRTPSSFLEPSNTPGAIGLHRPGPVT